MLASNGSKLRVGVIGGGFGRNHLMAYRECENVEVAACGEGAFAGTSDGSLLAVDGSGHRVLASGLPCVNAVAVGA